MVKRLREHNGHWWEKMVSLRTAYELCEAGIDDEVVCLLSQGTTPQGIKQWQFYYGFEKEAEILGEDDEALEKAEHIYAKHLRDVAEKFIKRAERYETEKSPTAGWISVNDRLPELPGQEMGFNTVLMGFTTVLVCYRTPKGELSVTALDFEKAKVRGKIVTRWRYPFNAIFKGGEVLYWKPLPDPPME